MSGPMVSVVIPAMNEERRLPATMEALDVHLAGRGTPYELIVVNDGSTDRTGAIADAFVPRDGRLVLLNHPHRMGKGAAVRSGILQAQGDTVAFIDADLAAGPEAFAAVIMPVENGLADVAIGSRYIRGACIQFPQPLGRRLIGRVFRIMVRPFLPGIYDTQVGLKAFTAQVGRSIFTDLRTAGFAFDVEVLLRARASGYRIVEVPITWRHQSLSRLHSLLTPVEMLMDLVRILWRQWAAPHSQAAGTDAARGDRHVL